MYIMNREGFTLLEVIATLVIMSIIFTSIFPLIKINISNLNKNREQVVFINIFENILESLQSSINNGDNIVTYGVDFNKIINQLEKKNKIKASFNIDSESYDIYIEKKERGKKLWEVKLKLEGLKNEKEIKVILPKPGRSNLS